MILDYTELNVNKIVEEMTGAGIPNNNEDKQCLAVRGIRFNDTFTYEWYPVKCVDHSNSIEVLCEIRIETITYAWIPNWLTVILLILTLVLLVTCCVAAMSYKQHRPRTYRGRDQQSPQGASYPTDDLPPKYSDVTGLTTEQGKFDKYKNKGKEILAKIYVVNDK